ncbi:MAG: NERD domain-containing protein [Acetobacteraceae bacterium]|nr:NERD domain-containing protein [Acetobacteraceae bacterium]
MGPLAGTLPLAAAVLVCVVGVLVVVRVASTAIRRGRPGLLLGSSAFALTAFVAGCVTFQTFASGTSPTGAFEAVFVGIHGALLGAVFVLGLLTTAALGLTRPPAGLAEPGLPREDEPAADERRAAAIGGLGEALVRAELEKLGWPMLSNVVLARNGWSVEIDHLVRAPDAIVVIETKTLSGVVRGEPDAECWFQQTRSGVRRFLNPLVQNKAHMEAVRAVIENPAVSLRGLVVSAGRSRFEAPIAGCVVPLRDLTTVLRDSVAAPALGKPTIAAWAALVAEAESSNRRRAAHTTYARLRKRVGPAWLWAGGTNR